MDYANGESPIFHEGAVELQQYLGLPKAYHWVIDKLHVDKLL